MNNELKIRTLIDRFFDGETTLSEERQLYAFFSQEPADLPEDLRPLRPLFLDLAAVQSVAVLRQQTQRPPGSGLRRWATAAAVAVLVVGGALLLFRSTEPAAADEDLVAIVYGQRTTDRSVVIGEMQKTMTAMTVGDGTDVVEQQLKAMFSNE